jgi:uncharacterized lipoprotein YbaY
MKHPTLCLVLAGAAAIFTAGCGHIDLTSNGNPDRVLTGTVDLSPQAGQVPPGAQLVVRVIDPNPDTLAPPLQTSAQTATPKAVLPEVLGEQTFKDLGDPPFQYRVEYRADDVQLQRGLTIEARISLGDRLLFSNTTSYSVGVSDVNDPHPVLVDRVGSL